MAEQDERAAFEAWFANFRHGWKTEKDVAFDAFKAGAAQAATPAPAEALSDAGSLFNAVARAMDMASMLAGAVARNDTEQADAYSASLRRKLWRIAELAATPAPAPAQAQQDERANGLLIGQAQQLIGALMNHGLVARSLPEDQYLNLWDVVKRQLRCVNQEGARAAQAATPAPAPLTDEQFERLYNNLPPSIQQDARSRLAFIRIGRAVEAAHGIGQGKEASNAE